MQWRQVSEAKSSKEDGERETLTKTRASKTENTNEDYRMIPALASEATQHREARKEENVRGNSI